MAQVVEHLPSKCKALSSNQYHWGNKKELKSTLEHIILLSKAFPCRELSAAPFECALLFLGL
jgi:hypothetical protein